MRLIPPYASVCSILKIERGKNLSRAIIRIKRKPGISPWCSVVQVGSMWLPETKYSTRSDFKSRDLLCSENNSCRGEDSLGWFSSWICSQVTASHLWTKFYSILILFFEVAQYLPWQKATKKVSTCAFHPSLQEHLLWSDRVNWLRECWFPLYFCPETLIKVY